MAKNKEEYDIHIRRDPSADAPEMKKDGGKAYRIYAGANFVEWFRDGMSERTIGRGILMSLEEARRLAQKG